MTPIRTLVAGLGNMGMSHALAYTRIPGFEVVGVCERRIAKRELPDALKGAKKFDNFDKALEYGYNVAAPAQGVCISDPVRGGMGFHYTRGDKDLIGDGVVNLLEPEFLVYAPKPNGGVKFAGLDYFVPYDTWPHAEPPSLVGVTFQREDAFQAFVMHIWLYWHNPAGLFENYNPSVPLC